MEKKKSTGVHSRVAALIQPSFQKYKKGRFSQMHFVVSLKKTNSIHTKVFKGKGGHSERGGKRGDVSNEKKHQKLFFHQKLGEGVLRRRLHNNGKGEEEKKK